MTEQKKLGFFVDAKRLIGVIIVLILLAAAVGVGYYVGYDAGKGAAAREIDWNG
jgi:hypothetical protein